jgi:hypothetical protein
MAKLTTLFPDSGDKKSPVQLTTLNNLERTQQQVQTLLSITANCESVLVFQTETGDTVEVPDEVKDSAAETYLAVQHQLRNIVLDPIRWDNSDTGDIQTRELVEGNVSLLKKQQDLLSEQAKPHRRLNCQMKLFQNGWVAWVGAELPTSDTLHGIGTSPELALAAFDLNYSTHLAQVTYPFASEPQQPSD